VRGVGLSLGHEEKEVTSAESQNRDVIRKSIVAIQPIAVGELLTEENLGVMRPGTGISPMKWVDVIGQPAKRSYEAHDMIELS
jgi:sialic acid synthase SpsE